MSHLMYACMSLCENTLHIIPIHTYNEIGNHLIIKGRLFTDNGLAAIIYSSLRVLLIFLNK